MDSLFLRMQRSQSDQTTSLCHLEWILLVNLSHQALLPTEHLYLLDNTTLLDPMEEQPQLDVLQIANPSALKPAGLPIKMESLSLRESIRPVILFLQALDPMENPFPKEPTIPSVPMEKLFRVDLLLTVSLFHLMRKHPSTTRLSPCHPVSIPQESLFLLVLLLLERNSHLVLTILLEPTEKLSQSV
jgi:hypothetical protein